MKLPTVPTIIKDHISKASVIAVLVAGGVIGGALGVAHNPQTVNLKSASSQSEADTQPAADNSTASADPAAAVDTDPSASNTTTGTTPKSTSSGSMSTPMSTEAPQSAPAAEQAPPRVITDTTQFRQQNAADPASSDVYCVFSWSDGTTQTKYVGTAKNSDLDHTGRTGLVYSCAPPAN